MLEGTLEGIEVEVEARLTGTGWLRLRLKKRQKAVFVFVKSFRCSLHQNSLRQNRFSHPTSQPITPTRQPAHRNHMRNIPIPTFKC